MKKKKRENTNTNMRVIYTIKPLTNIRLVGKSTRTRQGLFVHVAHVCLARNVAPAPLWSPHWLLCLSLGSLPMTRAAGRFTVHMAKMTIFIYSFSLRTCIQVISVFFFHESACGALKTKNTLNPVFWRGTVDHSTHFATPDGFCAGLITTNVYE